MDRRDLLKVLGVGCLASIISPTKLFSTKENQETPEIPITFCTNKNLNPENLTLKALKLHGNLGDYISKGDIVVVKPNIGWDRKPQQAANTNPLIVETVIKQCLNAGAKNVKVFDNTCNDPRRCYIRSGIKDAVERAGGIIDFMEKRRFKKMDIKGEKLKSWAVYKDAVECDKFINLPILKHHSLSRLTIGMKNLMGIVDDPRGIWHKNLDTYLVDITRFIKPTLTIVDAYRVLTRNGPSGGSLNDVKMYNTIIISKDPVGADAQAAQMMGISPETINYIKLAKISGLGSLSLSSNRIKKGNKVENTSDQ